MSRLQFCKPISHNIPCVTSLHRAPAEQVRMTSIAPAVDCGEVEVAGCRVGLWESSGQKVGQRHLEFGACLAETAGGHLQRNVARLDAEAHGATTVNSAYRLSYAIPADGRLEVVEAVANRTDRGLVVPSVDGHG